MCVWRHGLAVAEGSKKDSRQSLSGKSPQCRKGRSTRQTSCLSLLIRCRLFTPIFNLSDRSTALTVVSLLSKPVNTPYLTSVLDRVSSCTPPIARRCPTFHQNPSSNRPTKVRAHDTHKQSHHGVSKSSVNHQIISRTAHVGAEARANIPSSQSSPRPSKTARYSKSIRHTKKRSSYLQFLNESCNSVSSGKMTKANVK